MVPEQGMTVTLSHLKKKIINTTTHHPLLTTDNLAMTEKLSHVEHVKADSHQLRGTIQTDLVDTETPFSEDMYNLLKFHGLYQGYNRDTATERKKQKLEKEYEMMIRVRIPGGRMNRAQYLHFDTLADQYGGGKLRFTTRQAIQYHNILKGDLHATMAGINESLFTTEAACGDVVRNVTTIAAPIRDKIHERLYHDADMLSAALLPRSNAYAEIWLDNEKFLDIQNPSVNKTGDEVEDLYGPTYLPRKFKIGITVPEDNSVDVLTNDLGIVALFDDQQTLLGYNIHVGGGLGITHNKPETYPRLASAICFVGPDDLLAAARAVVTVHRDWGDRTNRKHARIKYVVEEKGVSWVKAEMEKVMGRPLADPRPQSPYKIVDHLGWQTQGDGHLYLGLPVLSGRVHDVGDMRLRTALRHVVTEYAPLVIVSPTQDVILGDIRPEDRAAVEEIFHNHGVKLRDEVSNVRRWSMACPALPTCGLALTEAERIHDPLMANIETMLADIGLDKDLFTIRITGCPNGCARPYAGDVGLVGRIPGFYALYLGGDFLGTRLNEKVLDKLAYDAIPATLKKALVDFRDHREEKHTTFGDYCHDRGVEYMKALLADAA
jgi:sulfite reductase (ferredoxin)